MRRPAIVALMILLAWIGVVWLERAASGEKKIGDLGPQLPRIAPKEPKDAVKTFTLAPGFRIELVACEPLIRSPVAIDFDEDGRLYVAEYPEYNLHNDPTFKEKGGIKRLEDTDGDGVFDKATAIVRDLPAPTAVACWDGGVFVGSVPNISYYKAFDDGRKTEQAFVFTGFERDRAGEGMLNSIRWGLDNRFHMSTSLAGGQIRPGGQPKADPVSVRSRFLIFDPRSGRFETTSGAGQHGMSMDDWGNTFVCDNSNPIHYVYYDGRYAARNPYAVAPPVAANIYERLAEPNLQRTSSFEPWRIVRTKLRVAGLVNGPTEGGRVGGHFTAATGVTIYRGDAYPDSMRGQAFVGDVSNNIVHRMTLTPKGIGFVASRADQGREFLASSDNWFRPCQFANGPDGCLYVVDIYRELIETTESIPSEILKHLHPRSGFERGRIWRIVPEGKPLRPAPRLGKASTAELVALLDHANGWHRDTASRLLYQRRDLAAAPLLAKLARTAKSPQGRMHALYALAGLDELDVSHVAAALADADPRVREHALRLSERFPDRPEILDRTTKMQGDNDVRVRWQLAFSQGAEVGPVATEMLRRIAIQDAIDPWFRFAIMTSSKDRAGALVKLLAEERNIRESREGQSLLLDLASAIGLSRRADDIASLLEATASLPAADAKLGRDLTAALLLKLPPAHRAKLQSAPVAAVLKDLLADARRTVLDAKRPSAERASAARNLRLGGFADAQPLYVQLLDPRHPEDVQKAILDALGSYDEPAATSLILDAWASLSPGVRSAATETLLSRPASIGMLFDAIERKKIKTSELDPARMALVRATADAALKGRAERLFAGAALSKRSEVIAAYKGALNLSGEVDRGRQLFRKHCALCHRLENVGEQIGASLSGIRERGPEFLLVNILDPNREVLPKFLSYQAQTDAGRSITGMILNESATSVTLRRPDGTSDTVPRVNLESLRATGVSYMPEGFETHLSVAEMADLIAYLLATP